MSDRPTLRQLKRRPSLWFWESMSKKANELHIVYPDGSAVSNNSIYDTPTGWCSTNFNHKEYLEDTFNNFEFLGFL